MESKQIEEGNRLIAEFMGQSNLTKIKNTGRKVKTTGKGYYQEQILVSYVPAYNGLWNLLMPVVEKISRIEFERRYDEYLEKWVIWTHHPVTFGMLDEQGRPMVRFYCNTLHFGDTLIQAAWNAVVDFIKWYNEQSLSLTQLNKDK